MCIYLSKVYDKDKYFFSHTMCYAHFFCDVFIFAVNLWGKSLGAINNQCSCVE